MSRSNPTLQNPAHRFFEWNGATGDVYYYDKEVKKQFIIPKPFEFLVLDELSTITGFNDDSQSGYWSNEVRNISKDELRVGLFKKGIQYVGLYMNDQRIKQVPPDANYTKSVYIAFKENGEWMLGNIKFAGAALRAWIEFTKHNKVQNGKTLITGFTEGKKGIVKFAIPTFEYTSSDKDEDEIAILLDKALQMYLSQYLAAPVIEDSVHSDEPMQDSFNTDDGKASPEQVADFEKRKAQKFEIDRQVIPSEHGEIPEDDPQATYNRQAVAEILGDEEPMPELPPEYQ